jgi:hypothetical protein
MGKVVHIDRDIQEMFDKLEELKRNDIQSICVVCSHTKGVEEFFFLGTPGVIYQTLALAQAHILQNYSLMDDCECGYEGAEEDE